MDRIVESPAPTFVVYGIVSGEPMLCDEASFDPAHHVREQPTPKAAPKARDVPKVRGA